MQKKMQAGFKAKNYSFSVTVNSALDISNGQNMKRSELLKIKCFFDE